MRGCALLFLIVAAVFSFHADAQEKGAAYTVVVPISGLVSEGMDWTQTNQIYGIRVMSEPVWGSTFPHFGNYQFEKAGRKDGLIEYEFRRYGSWLKLRMSDASLLDHYATPGIGVTKLQDKAFRQIAEKVFGGSDIPGDVWMALVRYAYRLGGSALLPLDEFRGGRYLNVDLRSEGSAYNTARLNQTQWLARDIAERMDQVKSAGELADVGLSGLRLNFSINAHNFVSNDGAVTDRVTWYIESGLVPALRDFEITSQDFIDQSVIVVNGTRIEVQLGDQG